MSTTTTAVLDSAPAARPPVAKKRNGGGARLFWIAGGVIVAVGVVMVPGRNLLMPAISDTRPDIYAVTRRSFPIIEQAKGELEAKKTTDIKSKVEGRSTIIWLIDEGTNVEEGDLLVRLASDKIKERIVQQEAQEASAIATKTAAEKDLEILFDENKSNIRKAVLKLELAEIDRDKYINGDAEVRRQELNLELARAGQSLVQAIDNYEITQRLFEQEFESEQKLKEDRFKKDEAERSKKKAKLKQTTFETYEYPKEIKKLESDVAEAEQELERVRKSSSAKEDQKKAEVESKRAQLLNTQNQLKKLREQLGYCEMKAPGPGIVVYETGSRWNPQRIAEGAEVYERQTLVSLPDPAAMLVKVRIHEAKMHRIEIGQKVELEIDAVPEKVFTGEVTRIAPLADSRNSWLNPDLKEYETEIALNESGPALKPGITARASIRISFLENELCVPSQAIYTKGGKHYVFVDDGSEGKVREVTLSEASSEYVGIESGLSEGEGVLLSVSDIVRSTIPEAKVDERGKRPEALAGTTVAEQKVSKPKRGSHGKRGGSRRGGPS